MARKKKEKVVAITESTPIKYEGTVIIKKLNKGKVTSVKKIHNKGYDRLFKFLLTCLTGDMDKQELPGYCVPVYKEAGDIQYVGTCVPIANRQLKQASDRSYLVEYKFYLPYSTDYIRGFDGLYIYPTNAQYHPATDPKSSKVSDYSDYLQMSIDLVKETVASPKEDILIIWQLQLTNPNT